MDWFLLTNYRVPTANEEEPRSWRRENIKEAKYTGANQRSEIQI